MFQTLIERYVHWNEDIGEWQLKCVAYSGNNMRKLEGDASNKYQEKEVNFFFFTIKMYKKINRKNNNIVKLFKLFFLFIIEI